MENLVEEINKNYYEKWGIFYEEYQSYFRNSILLNQWKRNIEKITKVLNNSFNNQEKFVLDFGCGTGLFTILLLKMGFNVIAIDLSPTMISQAKKKVMALPNKFQERVTFICGGINDLYTLKNDSLHLIFESSVLHHIENYEDFIRISNEKILQKGLLYIGREPKAEVKEKSLVGKILDIPLTKIDLFFYNQQFKNNFKEQFDMGILPHYKEGGVSYKKVVNEAYNNNFSLLFEKKYKWRKSRQGSFLNSKIFGFLDPEIFGRVYFDICFKKE